MANVLIETAASKTDPADVLAEEIFVPDSRPPEKAGDGPTQARPALKARDIEALDFDIDGAAQPFRTVSLRHPFRLDGAVVREIIVRRLTVGQVGELIDTRAADLPDYFDIYSAMTGFPAAVLRGLIDIDGEAVAGACYDFLPLYFHPAPAMPAVSSSTLPDGAVS